jgi:DNA-binding NtrC family response regulator
MMVVAVGITSEEVRSLAGKAPAGRTGRISGLLKCLVVSGDVELRHRLDTMADLAGWSACEAPADAAELRSLVDGDYHLVITDIARPLGERVTDTVEIAEEFASRPNTLVVVCGSGESVDEELWARQLGAWVYLPGVSGGDALMSLFAEAQRVVERRGVFQFV